MAKHKITSNATSGFNTEADFDSWVVLAGVTVDVAHDQAFFGGKSWEYNTFTIRGTVQTTGNFNAFHLKANHTTVIVEDGGAIHSAKSAILMLDNNCKVFNDGTIDAIDFGVRLYGEESRLTNDVHGSISSDNTGASVAGANSEVKNYGTIEGLVGVSVTATSGTFELLNAQGGTIQGSKYAYAGSSERDNVENHGQFVGDVYLRSGADTFISVGGTVTGSVFGGTGNDTFYIDQLGLNLVEIAGGGADVVNTSVGYTLGDFFENLVLTGAAAIDGTGNALRNKIQGNSAVNSLSGLGGRDNISAGAGNDLVSGGTGGDTLDGGIGADHIHGGAGGDVITGGSGRDHIVGEQGNDRLAGGSARDHFVFADGHGKDRVIDFHAKGSQHDVLDLTDVSAILSFSDLKHSHIHQVGADVVITDDTSQIVLVDVQLSDLTKRDFLF